MRDFRELRVWEKSHELVLAVYRATEGFPAREIYSLTSRIRRSVMSIPSNITEGSHRSSDADFARFSYVTIGSAGELEYQLILAKDLHYLTDEEHRALNETLNQVKRMLNSFIQTLKK